MLSISQSVFFNLILPIFSVGFGDSVSSLTNMSMPKTAMYENYLFPGRENQVGFSGEVFHMEAVSITQRVDKSPDNKLWGCVFRLNPSHYFTAFHSGFKIGFIFYCLIVRSYLLLANHSNLFAWVCRVFLKPD